MDKDYLPPMACIDPDEIFPCPYDPHHLVRASRFPYHIVQCRKNNPQLAKRMKACPFNARHIVLKTEMERHVMRCPDKITIAQDLELERQQGFPIQLAVPQYIDGGHKPLEDWENDIDESKRKPFIWGRTGGAVSTMPRIEETPPSSNEDQKQCTVKEQARGVVPPSEGSSAKDDMQEICTAKMVPIFQKRHLPKEPFLGDNDSGLHGATAGGLLGKQPKPAKLQDSAFPDCASPEIKFSEWEQDAEKDNAKTRDVLPRKKNKKRKRKKKDI